MSSSLETGPEDQGLSVRIVESSLWDMYGHELDRDTHKIKENGRIFWGSEIIIKNEDGTYDYSRIDPAKTEAIKFDTDRKALNFAKKIKIDWQTINKKEWVQIYTRARYDAYLARYEKMKIEEAQRS